MVEDSEGAISPPWETAPLLIEVGDIPDRPSISAAQAIDNDSGEQGSEKERKRRLDSR